jgi:hypothetical protein
MVLQMVKMVISSVNTKHGFIRLSDAIEPKKGIMIIK